MSNIFFSSDHHFSHRNIIKYCERPFDTTTDMDIHMVEEWNKVVKPNDTVYYIGDFMMPRQYHLADMFLDGLNGKKHLIVGNHDENRIQKKPQWESVNQILELKIGNPRKGGKWIVMCHYPMASWNGSFHGSIHLHGHTHGTYEAPPWPSGNPRLCLDVGVDTHDFRPWSLEEIEIYFSTLTQ